MKRSDFNDTTRFELTRKDYPTENVGHHGTAILDYYLGVGVNAKEHPWIPLDPEESK